MSARTCPTCGHPLSPFARYCVNCGDEVRADGTLVTSSDGTATVAVPWRAREAVIVFIISMLLGLIATFPVALLVHGKAAVSAGGTFVAELALLASVVGWVRLRYRGGAKTLGLGGPAVNAPIGLAVGVAGWLSSIVVLSIITAIVRASGGASPKQPDQLGVSGQHLSTAVLVVIGFSVIVLAPVAEEMFFRGFLFRSLRRSMKPWPAVLVSAACFALVHVFPLILLPIFVLGVIFAWTVEWRGSIVPTILAHMTFNAIGFYALLHSRG